MRTTLTLDDDVVNKIREDMRRTGRSFKDTVNENLRIGFLFKDTPKPKKFVVKAKDMGPMAPGLSLDSISALLDELEGPMHR